MYNGCSGREGEAMKDLICIVCPRGCHLKVEEGEPVSVTGNRCPRGAEYGKNEVTHPTRMVTSTVKITGALHRRCPVKTSAAVPREKIMEIMQALADVTLTAPVHCGQVVLSKAAGTSADIICTKSM